MRAMTDPGPVAALRDFDGLMPLAAAQAALLAAVITVAPVRRPSQGELGRIVAEPVLSPGAHPPQRLALRDGYQIASRDTIGATPYAPAYLAGRPPAVRAGDAMIEGYDAVLPPDCMTFGISGGEVLQSLAPGAGTRDMAENLARGSVIVEAGLRLRPDRLAVLVLAGVVSVAVRIPRVRIEGTGPLARLIADLAVAAGADIDALEADMTLCLCEPGYAATASNVARFAVEGTVIAHGLAVRPGDSIGLCTTPGVDERRHPIIIVPDRIEDVLAAWLLLIEPCIAALAAATDVRQSETLPLSGKIVSAPGMADIVLLRRSLRPPNPAWEPLATGALTWSAFAAADAYCLIPPELEGFQAGTRLTGVFL